VNGASDIAHRIQMDLEGRFARLFSSRYATRQDRKFAQYSWSLFEMVTHTPRAGVNDKR
jgi:hypothetical protein